MKTWFMFLVLLVPLQTAQAISIGSLPSQLQSCISSSDCFVDTSAPAFSFGGMQAYNFFDDLNGTPAQGYALRYALLPPSGQDSTGTGTTGYGGDIWLTVYNSYDLSVGTNKVTVYTDTVSPQPLNIMFNDVDGLDVDAQLTNGALLSGAGNYSSFLDITYTGNTTGNMSLEDDFGNPVLVPCAAAGCSVSALLNLIYIDFIDTGGTASLVFDVTDPRSLLFQVGIADDGTDSGSPGSTTQSYYVAAVPVPAALWLFLSGLTVLGWRVRRSVI